MADENMIDSLHFEIEKKYHKLLLGENSDEKRKIIYRQAYTEIYDFVNKYYPSQNFFGGSERFVYIFQSLFKDKIVVDYGCGMGFTTQLIGKYSSRVIGVEVESSLVERAIRLAAANNSIAEFYTVEEFEKLDIEVDTFYSNDVVEHLHPNDLKNHLETVYQKLKKNGKYLIITPHLFSGPHDISGKFLKKGSLPLGLHLKEYTYSELSSIIYKCGFSKCCSLLSSYGLIRLGIYRMLKIFLVSVNVKIFFEKVLPKFLLRKAKISALLNLEYISIIVYK